MTFAICIEERLFQKTNWKMKKERDNYANNSTKKNKIYIYT